MDVSKNSGIPKSSILIGISIINHPFWGTTILGNPHIANSQQNSVYCRYGSGLLKRVLKTSRLVTWHAVTRFLCGVPTAWNLEPASRLAGSKQVIFWGASWSCDIYIYITSFLKWHNELSWIFMILNFTLKHWITICFKKLKHLLGWTTWDLYGGFACYHFLEGQNL